jgi:hypothetical protein
MKQEPQYDEKATWTDSENCILDFEKRTPVPDGDKIIGTHYEKASLSAKKSDMIFNLNLHKDRVEKLQKEIEANNNKISTFGKKPVKTPEMVRLQRTITDLEKINQIEQLERSNAEKENEIQRAQEMIKIRERTLASAPKEARL